MPDRKNIKFDLDVAFGGKADSDLLSIIKSFLLPEEMDCNG